MLEQSGQLTRTPETTCIIFPDAFTHSSPLQEEVGLQGPHRFCVCVGGGTPESWMTALGSVL